MVGYAIFCVFVSIRHQPEYLPSLSDPVVAEGFQRYVFQSGISLSICLHAEPMWGARCTAQCGFQSGISLSICLHMKETPKTVSCLGPSKGVSIRHQPEYLPSPSGIRHMSLRRSSIRFQSGISLSICLHDNNRRMRLCRCHRAFQSGISLSICLHTTPAKASVSLSLWRVSIRHQPEYLPSHWPSSPGGMFCGPSRFNQASA